MESKQELVFLGNYSQREAGFVESLLESYNISSIRKYPESSGYLQIYMGYNVYGLDIYVSKDKLEVAREVLKSEFGGLEANDIENNVDHGEDLDNLEQSKSFLRAARFLTKGVLAAFFVYILIIIFKVIIELIF